MSDNNYWSNLMENDENAANYMYSYGEGPGCETRLTIGSFINDDEDILDVGCGPGFNYDHFERYGPSVIYKGLDLSPRFIRVARQRIMRDFGVLEEIANESFAIGDCRNIPELDDSWDVVILQDVLEHTNGYEKTVSEALRVATKRVIITFWRMRYQDTQINDDTAEGDDGYGAVYDRAEWEKHLDSLGYVWLNAESSPEANRYHLFYIIDKEEPR